MIHVWHTMPRIEPITIEQVFTPTMAQCLLHRVCLLTFFNCVTQEVCVRSTSANTLIVHCMPSEAHDWQNIALIC